MLCWPTLGKREILISRWRLAASRPAVWHILRNLERWPEWWPGIEYARLGPIEPLSAGRQGRQAVRIVWRTALGLQTVVDLCVVRCEQFDDGHCEAEAISTRAPVQRAMWMLNSASPRSTDVTFRWETDVDSSWVAIIRPIGRVLRANGHFCLMRACADGMARHLGCTLPKVSVWSMSAG